MTHFKEIASNCDETLCGLRGTCESKRHLNDDVFVHACSGEGTQVVHAKKAGKMHPYLHMPEEQRCKSAV
eukprot:131047-Pelagomonas_calceolata.AAC.1